MSASALVSSFISSMLFTLMMLISKKSVFNRQKRSPFECGFNSMNKVREPFSMRFFLLAILFIIFDVEIVMIIPMLITCSSSSLPEWSHTSMWFFLILIAGILVEWKEGTFEWKD